MNSDWLQSAACRGVPSEIFYPELPERGGAGDYRAALALCAQCPVKTECLAEELGYGRFDQHGIRGGLTSSARRSLLKYPNGRARTVAAR